MSSVVGLAMGELEVGSGTTGNVVGLLTTDLETFVGLLATGVEVLWILAP